jgi:ABC-type tungstate transport system permease subunit
MGAYVLVERMTWAAQENRRGLEVLVQGDPVLRTDYVSYLVRETSPDARAWFDWLSSEPAQTIIANFSLNGMRVFTPATSGEAEGPPSRT